MIKRVFYLSLCILFITACVPAAHSKLIIDEHLLTAPPDLSTDQLVFHFAQGDQNQILAKTAAYRDFRKQYLEYNRQILAPFGYSLPQDATQAASGGSFDIARGDQWIEQGVMYMGPISLNASHTDFVGLPAFADRTSVFTRDRLESIPVGAIVRQPYGYVGDRLLSVQISDLSHGVSRIQVYLDDQQAYESQFNNISTYASFDGPWTYGDHWALILLDAKLDGEQGPAPYERLIQDGQDVTGLKGYDQSFEFSLLDGQPFYFYQKSGKIGISFAAEGIATNYDEVPHYQCCTPALLNPGKSLNMVWFFARRGTAWYYVEAYVPMIQ